MYICAHVHVFLKGLYHKIVTQERELDVWQKSEEIFHCLPSFSSLELYYVTYSKCKYNKNLT